MKVKFLRSGIEAHASPGRGNFVFTEGEEMSGLSEEAASQMEKDGNAKILGYDDVEEEVVADEEAEAEVSSKSDDADDETEDDSNGTKKPWEK